MLNGRLVLGEVGQASACRCVTDANTDAHPCAVPGARLYLNMGERSKAICGLPVNGRLVSREKSARRGWRGGCSSTQCMYMGGDDMGRERSISQYNSLVEIASSLLSWRHRYLLTPTHTLKLMQMQPVPMKN